MRQFDFLPSFLFLHPPLPLGNFKLEFLKVLSVTVAGRAPGAACSLRLGVPPFKMMEFWFFINGLDNVYPATGTKNVPSVAPSKGQVSRRMGRFAATVGTRRRRRKAMGFIFRLEFYFLFLYFCVFL